MLLKNPFMDNEQSATPTTTSEQDRQTASVREAVVVAASSKDVADTLKTAGQRRVNLIWEATQAVISYVVVGTAMYVSGKIALLVLDPLATERATSFATTAFVLISNCTFLIIGFYFGRTNHTRSGGIGYSSSSSEER